MTADAAARGRSTAATRRTGILAAKPRAARPPDGQLELRPSVRRWCSEATGGTSTVCLALKVKPHNASAHTDIWHSRGRFAKLVSVCVAKLKSVQLLFVSFSAK